MLKQKQKITLMNKGQNKFIFSVLVPPSCAVVAAHSRIVTRKWTSRNECKWKLVYWRAWKNKVPNK